MVMVMMMVMTMMLSGRSGRSGGGEVVVEWWWFEVQDTISVFFYVLRFDKKKVLTLERFQKWMGGVSHNSKGFSHEIRVWSRLWRDHLKYNLEMAYCCAQKSLEQNCALTRMTLLGFLHLWSPQSWWWCWLWVCRKGVHGAPWWALRLILQSLSAEGNSEYHEGDLAAASSHGWQPWPQPLLSISNVKTNIFMI